MTMSDGALDLSISSYEAPSQRASRHPDGNSDSGRASTDSTSSDPHEEVKVRHRSSPSSAAPISTSVRLGGVSSSSVAAATGAAVFPPTSHFRDVSDLSPHLQRPISSSSSPLRLSHLTHTRSYSNPSSPVPGVTNSAVPEEDSKPPLVEDRVSDARVAPIRPFKMYPVDPFNVYSNPLMTGAGGALSPTPVGLQSLYDTSSPSSFPSFPLTPLTSHLLQRKRRAENRDSNSGGSNNGAQSSSISAPKCSSPNNSGSYGTSNNGSSGVSTSSPSSPKEDSNGSDGEKRMKMSGSSLDMKKDDAYWDRRRKNNEAAKRSRDARRQKEEEIAMRAAFLEQENLKLRAQVAILKNETAKLHYMLYNRM